VELISDYVVCKEGDTLSSNQAALLRVFDIKMAAFKMYPAGCWTAEGGTQSLLHPPAAFWLPLCNRSLLILTLVRAVVYEVSSMPYLWQLM